MSAGEQSEGPRPVPHRQWTGIVLRTSLGTLINPAPFWSERTIDALERAVGMTLMLDGVVDVAGPARLSDAVGAALDQAHDLEDEYVLWERVEAAMVADHESGRTSAAWS